MSKLSETGCTPVCVYMRDEVCSVPFLCWETEVNFMVTLFVHVCLGEWRRSTKGNHSKVSGSHSRKCHCQVCGLLVYKLSLQILTVKLFYDLFLRFLLKKNTPGEEQDGREVTEIVAMPIMPVAKETTSNPSAVSHPETSLADAAKKSSDHGSPMETANSLSSISALPVQKEEVLKSQDAVRPKVPLVGSKTPEEDVEEAGPSGLNAHHSSSSSSIPSAAFIPFSGGGQRLGGLGVATPSSTLSTLTAAVESPKAKKAKSSCSSSAKVSY